MLQDATNKKTTGKAPLSAAVKKPAPAVQTAVLGKRRSPEPQSAKDAPLAADSIAQAPAPLPLSAPAPETSADLFQTHAEVDQLLFSGDNDIDLDQAENDSEPQVMAAAASTAPCTSSADDKHDEEPLTASVGVENVATESNVVAAAARPLSCDLFSPRPEKKARLAAVAVSTTIGGDASSALNAQLVVMHAKLASEQHLSQTLRDQLAATLAQRDTLAAELDAARTAREQFEAEQQRTWYMSLMHSLAMADNQLLSRQHQQQVASASSSSSSASAPPVAEALLRLRVADLEERLAERVALEYELEARAARIADEQCTTAFANTILQQEKRELAHEFRAEMARAVDLMATATANLTDELAQRTETLDTLRQQMRTGMEAAVARVRALQEQIAELTAANAELTGRLKDE